MARSLCAAVEFLRCIVEMLSVRRTQDDCHSDRIRQRQVLLEEQSEICGRARKWLRDLLCRPLRRAAPRRGFSSRYFRDSHSTISLIGNNLVINRLDTLNLSRLHMIFFHINRINDPQPKVRGQIDELVEVKGSESKLISYKRLKWKPPCNVSGQFLRLTRV